MAPAWRAATWSEVSAWTPVPRAVTTMRCWPGAVPAGMMTTVRNAPAASAVIEPSGTGSLNRTASSTAPAGKPEPERVTPSPSKTVARSTLTLGARLVVVVEDEVVTVVAVVAVVEVLDVDDVDDVEGIDVEVEVDVEVDVDDVVVATVTDSLASLHAPATALLLASPL